MRATLEMVLNCSLLALITIFGQEDKDESETYFQGSVDRVLSFISMGGIMVYVVLLLIFVQ